LIATISIEVRNHSQNMASGAVPFGHTGFETRVQTIRQTLSCRSAGENGGCQLGYSDPQLFAVDDWLNSGRAIASRATQATINRQDSVWQKIVREDTIFTQLFCSNYPQCLPCFTPEILRTLGISGDIHILT